MLYRYVVVSNTPTILAGKLPDLEVAIPLVVVKPAVLYLVVFQTALVYKGL
jgi:hypothetical protein